MRGMGATEAKIMTLSIVASKNVCSDLLANFGKVICKL